MQEISDLWATFPQWESDSRFRTRNCKFVSRFHEQEARSSADCIAIMKPRPFFDLYLALLQGKKTKHILEVGYLEGGMPVFLADMLPEAKIVGIDIAAPLPAVSDFVRTHGLEDRVRYYPRTSQDNRAALREIFAKEFGSEPLDFIMDDASHQYKETKATFETCFSYLRPGAQYVIEDWGWAHWSGEQWQDRPNVFSGTTPLSQLLFELTMLLASNPGLVSRIEILNGSYAVITRGAKFPHGEEINIDASVLTAGRKFVGFSPG